MRSNLISATRGGITTTSTSAVIRRDVPALRLICMIAAAGRLIAKSGNALEGDLQRKNLWCRRTIGGPWESDVTTGEGDDEHWFYRRDPRIRFRWSEAVLRTTSGVPYLAPELPLLFKVKNPRTRDDVDARVVIPVLDKTQRDRLRWMLPLNHPWHSHLQG